MELKLSLFVHGVPNGQKIWGPREADLLFIESFYGRKSNVEVQLLVDVYETGGSVSCYYTFLKSGNVLGKDGRQGSYFALTVRVNAYYADLFNMYNILHATYQKFIISTVLSDSGSAVKFIIDDFDQVDGQLQNIEKEVKNYLSSFSIGSDLISLSGFTANAPSQPSTINLLECNSKNVLNHVKAKGNISVSPLYPTSQSAEQLRKKDEELESVKSNLDQQVTDAKKRSEQEIQVIKNERESAEKTINDLKKELSAKETKFNEVNAILANIKRSLNGIEGSNIPNDSVPKQRPHEKSRSHKKRNLTLGMIATLLILIVALYFISRDSAPETGIVTWGGQKGSESPSTDQNTNSSNSKEQLPKGVALKNVVIDIDGLKNSDNVMKMGQQYRVQAIVQNGEWITTDFKFNKDFTISPIHDSDCKIDYTIDGQIIASRTIAVKN